MSSYYKAGRGYSILQGALAVVRLNFLHVRIFALSVRTLTKRYQQVEFSIYFSEPGIYYILVCYAQVRLTPEYKYVLHGTLYTYKFYTVAVCENAILEVKTVQKLKNAMNTRTREPASMRKWLTKQVQEPKDMQIE